MVKVKPEYGKASSVRMSIVNDIASTAFDSGSGKVSKTLSLANITQL